MQSAEAARDAPRSRVHGPGMVLLPSAAGSRRMALVAGWSPIHGLRVGTPTKNPHSESLAARKEPLR